MADTELEVKFFVTNLAEHESRLQSLDAQLEQARTHEVNLRFDTPERVLTNSQQVLRLRQDSAARVTYKGPSLEQGGARLRQEYEFVVSDYEAARKLFEALGYEVSLLYEKYRATYLLGGVHVTLDEMPYGNFVEVEGPDPDSIRATAQRLGLDWEARVLESYTVLFDRLRSVLEFTFRDLSFANFQTMKATLVELGIRFADQ